MFSSANENNVGFSSIGNEEIETINGGASPIVDFSPPSNPFLALITLAVKVSNSGRK